VADQCAISWAVCFPLGPESCAWKKKKRLFHICLYLFCGLTGSTKGLTEIKKWIQIIVLKNHTIVLLDSLWFKSFYKIQLTFECNVRRVEPRRSRSSAEMGADEGNQQPGGNRPESWTKLSKQQLLRYHDKRLTMAVCKFKFNAGTDTLLLRYNRHWEPWQPDSQWQSLIHGLVCRRESEKISID